MLKSGNSIEPVIKWTGSKRQVAQILSRLIPNSDYYYEPFVGGGALLPFRKIKTGFASDIIPELIDLWNWIKEDPERTSFEYKIRWEKLQKEGYQVYYQIRDSFNASKNCFDFLFLTRTCVNGLIRYNEKGAFNNSFHLTRPGIHPSTLRQVILKWNYFLKGIEFENIDYREALSNVKKNSFIFLDPPYGGTRGRYTKNEFELEVFYNQLEELNSADTKWLLTFDGAAGKRKYIYELPRNIYKHKLQIRTGNSPFTKMMKTNIDQVVESVYINYEPGSELLSEFSDQINQEITLFTDLKMQS